MAQSLELDDPKSNNQKYSKFITGVAIVALIVLAIFLLTAPNKEDKKE